MKIPFAKMSGAGNDFVVVDNRAGIVADAAAFAIDVCHRRYGIGADGLLLVENSTDSAFTMKYYNADGSNAGMCGNGGRCIAKFAYDNGITTRSDFSFEAFGYTYNVHRLDETMYELHMKEPFGIIRNQQISLNDHLVKGNYINTGTDHAVIFLDENPDLGVLEAVDVVGVGRMVRHHAVYQPIGTNVNFVTKNALNGISIRTYERGVEDETLACGTGSVGSALLSSIHCGIQSPVQVTVKSGEVLIVTFNYDETDNRFTNVRLKGSAITTFTGEYMIHD